MLGKAQWKTNLKFIDCRVKSKCMAFSKYWWIWTWRENPEKVWHASIQKRSIRRGFLDILILLEGKYHGEYNLFIYLFKKENNELLAWTSKLSDSKFCIPWDMVSIRVLHSSTLDYVPKPRRNPCPPSLLLYPLKTKGKGRHKL